MYITVDKLKTNSIHLNTRHFCVHTAHTMRGPTVWDSKNNFWSFEYVCVLCVWQLVNDVAWLWVEKVLVLQKQSCMHKQTSGMVMATATMKYSKHVPAIWL